MRMLMPLMMPGSDTERSIRYGGVLTMAASNCDKATPVPSTAYVVSSATCASTDPNPAPLKMKRLAGVMPFDGSSKKSRPRYVP